MSNLNEGEARRPRDLSEATSQDQRFLAFSVNGEEYAIPLLQVKEVIGLPEITPIPYTPAHFVGIMNLRGQIISVIDLRLKFQSKKTEATGETTVIICDFESTSLGIVVDSVNSVMAPKPDELSGKPDIESKVESAFITGVVKRDKRLTLLLDLARLLSVEDLKAIRAQGLSEKAAA